MVDSPSRKALDGALTVEEECQARYNCQDLMGYLASKSQIKNEIVASASVYMHRFYQFFPVGGNYNWQDMAVACLFLAAKYEDSPRKLEYIVKYWNSCTKNLNSSAAEIEGSRHLPDRTIEDAKMREKIEDLLVLENVLLLTLGFDMQIQHAEFDITQTYPQLRLTKDTAFSAYKLAQSWTRLTPLSLLHRPEEIAAACIYYICRKTKTPLLDEDFRGIDVFNAGLSGNRTVMEPSSTVMNSHIPFATTSMPSSSSSTTVENNTSAAVSMGKSNEQPDWLNCFNESVRRFSPETRRPSPVPVTPQVVLQCIEELKFWALKLPPEVRRRLLAAESSSSAKQQQSLSTHATLPQASSSSKSIDASTVRKYHPTLLSSSSSTLPGLSSAKHDSAVPAQLLQVTVIGSRTSPCEVKPASPAPLVTTMISQACDIPKEVGNSRPGEAGIGEKWVT